MASTLFIQSKIHKQNPIFTICSIQYAPSDWYFTIHNKLIFLDHYLIHFCKDTPLLATSYPCSHYTYDALHAPQVRRLHMSVETRQGEGLPKIAYPTEHLKHELYIRKMRMDFMYSSINKIRLTTYDLNCSLYL